MNKKFPNSNFSNKLVLLTTVMIFVAAILFAFSSKFALGVVAIWIAAGALWLLRYSWQLRNPYIEITSDEMIINKSPILRKKIKLGEMKDITSSSDYSMKLGLENGKKIKISLLQVEKSQRGELQDAIREIVAEKNLVKH